jgi:hypothetical protein
MQPPNFHRFATLADAEGVCSRPGDGNLQDSLSPSIHFIWVGAEPPGETILRMHGWAWLNPSFTVCLWGDEALGGLADAAGAEHVRELMEAAPNAAALSDVGRFAILDRFGGIYLDTDMEACRPVAPLLGHRFGFVVRESRWLLVASALGLPRASMFGRVALRVMAKAGIQRGSIDNFVTGPPLITELGRAVRLLAVDGPEVLPEWTFFPDNPFRFPRRMRSALPPYGIHLFDHSWGNGNELQFSRRVARAALQSVSPRDIAIGRRRDVQLDLRRLAMVELATAATGKD